MSFKDNIPDEQVERARLYAEQDPELNEALRDFRLSVHAWSEAVYVRPRAVVEHAQRRIWRLATGWALGCVLVAGGAFGGFYGHLHRQQAAGWEHHPQETGIHETSAVKLEQPAVVQGFSRHTTRKRTCWPKWTATYPDRFRPLWSHWPN